VLLGRGKPEGLALMESTPDGAWRSFAAALVCLPAFLAMRAFAWSDLGAPPIGVGRSLVAELSGYVIAWFGFALASLAIVQSWGRVALWPRFIAAWNWTNVLQYAVLLVLMLPGMLGLPLAFAQVLTLAGLAYALWLEWFVVRHALGVDGLRAAVPVAVDFVLGLFLSGLIRSLSGG
jgi:hypothetical protein